MHRQAALWYGWWRQSTWRLWIWDCHCRYQGLPSSSPLFRSHSPCSAMRLGCWLELHPGKPAEHGKGWDTLSPSVPAAQLQLGWHCQHWPLLLFNSHFNLLVAVPTPPLGIVLKHSLCFLIPRALQVQCPGVAHECPWDILHSTLTKVSSVTSVSAMAQNHPLIILLEA